jgi:hypothetical protein
MGALEGLRSHIPGYPGLDEAAARVAADEQVRAYVGERLAGLRSSAPETA